MGQNVELSIGGRRDDDQHTIHWRNWFVIHHFLHEELLLTDAYSGTGTTGAATKGPTGSSPQGRHIWPPLIWASPWNEGLKQLGDSVQAGDDVSLPSSILRVKSE